nr:hypothetical protein [Tanacetum cinerariifolium]
MNKENEGSGGGGGVLSRVFLMDFAGKKREKKVCKKWAGKGVEHCTLYSSSKRDKGEGDSLIEVPLEDNKKKAEEKADTKSMKMELSCEWKLFTDGAASSNGFGAELILIDPKGKEYTYALCFRFETTNNEAEYAALSVGLRISHEMEITSLAIFVDS